MDINSLFPTELGIDDALQLLWPAVVYVFGMAAYAIFVFRFYRFLASRDMFASWTCPSMRSRATGGCEAFFRLVLYGAEYIILFPAFAFFWFAVLTVILALLSRDRAFSDILLIALATVGAIRVTAYYNEDLSKDLAKILPFAVLAIFLIDGYYFDTHQSLNVLNEATDHSERILYYLVFLIALEFALRLVSAVARLLGFRRRRTRALEKGVVPGVVAAPATPTGRSPARGATARRRRGSGRHRHIAHHASIVGLPTRRFTIRYCILHLPGLELAGCIASCFFPATALGRLPKSIETFCCYLRLATISGVNRHTCALTEGRQRCLLGLEWERTCFPSRREVHRHQQIISIAECQKQRERLLLRLCAA